MDLSRLKAINESNTRKELDKIRSLENKGANLDLQETIVKVVKSLVDYLDGHTSKTVILNQLKEISTPDALKVAQAVDEMHNTLKTHENVDLTPLVDVMNNVLNETKAIPKSQKDVKIPDPIDTRKQLQDLTDQVKQLIKVTKDKETIVEAPNVNVEPTKVNVKTDTKDIAKEVSKTTTAIDGMRKEQPIKDGAMQTQDISSLISENYDSFKIDYINDVFNEDEEPKVSKIRYYNGKKKVASLIFSYKNGELSGVSKA